MSSKENIDVQKGEFLSMTEIDRLKKDIYRPDMEKLQLFTAMLRRSITLKKAVVRHK